MNDPTTPAALLATRRARWPSGKIENLGRGLFVADRQLKIFTQWDFMTQLTITRSDFNTKNDYYTN